MANNNSRCFLFLSACGMKVVWSHSYALFTWCQHVNKWDGREPDEITSDFKYRTRNNNAVSHLRTQECHKSAVA